MLRTIPTAPTSEGFLSRFTSLEETCTKLPTLRLIVDGAHPLLNLDAVMPSCPALFVEVGQKWSNSNFLCFVTSSIDGAAYWPELAHALAQALTVNLHTLV